MRASKDVLDDDKLLSKPAEKLVYVVLCMYANNRTMQAYPSVKTLASKCLCSENTVRNALKRLEELGLIEIERRKDGNRNSTSVYTLMEIPKCFR